MMTANTSNPASTSERLALRQAIALVEVTKEKVEVAGKSSERGKQFLRDAQRRLEQFGDVDAEIRDVRTTSFKNAAKGGPKPSLALPADLLKRERARDEAASAVAAARAAHGSLVGEFAEAQAALRKAESKVSELADQVLVAEIAEQGSALMAIWNDLWATIDALNGLRSAGVQLPRQVILTLQSFGGMDHRQFPGNRNPQLARAVQHWKAYRDALCQSADATQPNPIDGGVTPAAAERVA
jgi:hypothetical protein